MPKKTGASKWFVPKSKFVDDNKKKEIFKDEEEIKHGKLPILKIAKNNIIL